MLKNRGDGALANEVASAEDFAKSVSYIHHPIFVESIQNSFFYFFVLSLAIPEAYLPELVEHDS